MEEKIIEILDMFYEDKGTNKHVTKKLLALFNIGSSTEIEPISLELDENTEAYLKKIDMAREEFDKYATEALRIPKELFGKK